MERALTTSTASGKWLNGQRVSPLGIGVQSHDRSGVTSDRPNWGRDIGFRSGFGRATSLRAGAVAGAKARLHSLCSSSRARGRESHFRGSHV